MPKRIWPSATNSPSRKMEPRNSPNCAFIRTTSASTRTVSPASIGLIIRAEGMCKIMAILPAISGRSITRTAPTCVTSSRMTPVGMMATPGGFPRAA